MLAHPLAQHVALCVHGITPRFEQLALAAQGFGRQLPVFGRQRGKFRRFSDASQAAEFGNQTRALRQQGDHFAGQSAFGCNQLRRRDREERLALFDRLSLDNMKLGNDAAFAVLHRLTTA